MGHGIAQVCAQAGYRARLCDVDQGALDRGLEGIRKSLDKLVSKDKLTAEAAAAALTNIERATELRAGVADASIVVEAVPERMDLKKKIFADLERFAPATALLGTNTSSLSVSEIASVTASAERVVGLHFFNPVPVMELVEIVRGEGTSDATVNRARAFAERIGKRSIVVKDAPGFATSRLGVILGAEAIRMLEAGVASAEDIDTAMELGYKHPIGPLKLTDLVGLDVRLAILEHLHREIGEQFKPPELLRKLVAAGKLGRKTGEGFYKY